MGTKHHIIPIFVPHVGCPHDCIFCNQRRIALERANIDENDIKLIIDNYIRTIPLTNEKLEIAFFGGSFTGIEISTQRKLLEIASNYKKNGYIDRIRLSTRPDYIDEERLDLLVQYDVDIIELGVQSMSPNVLENSYRGHSDIDVINATKLIKEYGFSLGLQMMVGLPGSNYEKEIYTANQLIKLRPSAVRIYPTLVIKDTYLERKYYSGEYNPLSLEQALSICMDLLMMFEYYDINVIRIGLQPTNNIAEKGDVISGPFHPAFRQLVEERVYRSYLKIFFETHKEIFNDIQVYINNREISNIVGQRSSNINFLKDLYGIKKIKIIGNDINKESFFIMSNGKHYELRINELNERYLVSKGLVIVN